jgi:hypothetical protein
VTTEISKEDAQRALRDVAAVEDASWRKLADLNEARSAIATGLFCLVYTGLDAYFVLDHFSRSAILGGLFVVTGALIYFWHRTTPRFGSEAKRIGRIPTPLTVFLVMAISWTLIVFPVNFALEAAFPAASKRFWPVTFALVSSLLSALLYRQQSGLHLFMIGTVIACATALWVPVEHQFLALNGGISLAMIGLGVAMILTRKWGHVFP